MFVLARCAVNGCNCMLLYELVGSKQQEKFARRLMPMVENPHWVLATLVICNTGRLQRPQDRFLQANSQCRSPLCMCLGCCVGLLRLIVHPHCTMLY
jgi:hypothetical protein